jgi:hypothetical protein
MKREETVYICERCGSDIRVVAKKFGPFHISGKRPSDWNTLKDPDNIYLLACARCVSDFRKKWNEYMQDSTIPKK